MWPLLNLKKIMFINFLHSWDKGHGKYSSSINKICRGLLFWRQFFVLYLETTQNKNHEPPLKNKHFLLWRQNKRNRR